MHVMLRWLSTGIATLAAAGVALAQPAPTETATALPHIARISGAGATVQRDTEEVHALAGEHLAFGDRVTTGGAQVQLVWSDGTLVSLDRQSSLAAHGPDLLAFSAGRLIVATPRLAEGALRVDTPAGIVHLTIPGEYRLTVDDVTATVGVVHGMADVRHMGLGVQIAAGQALTFRDGLAPGTPQAFNTAGLDTFVQWASEPVMAQAQSPSREYLADPRLEAYADVFDRHGQWQEDSTYGQVWFPLVGGDWRPFSQGYWQPFGGGYGPTWVAQDPWGWPTHHFGHWGMQPGGRWFWRPGRQWSPGRVSWSVGPGLVGWSPLGLHGDAWGWQSLVTPHRGVYPGGTLDPFRAWTIIPRDRFGARGGIRPYAIDARALDNLNAFVTQRVAPPFQHWRGPGYGAPYGAPFGAAGYGMGGFGWPTAPPIYGPRVGDDTTRALRRGVGPTFVDPPLPGPARGAPGAAQPRDDPYERARQQMVPRGRTRGQADDQPRTVVPRRQPPPDSAPPPAAAPPSSRQSRGADDARPAAGSTAPPARGVAVSRPSPRSGSPDRPARSGAATRPARGGEPAVRSGSSGTVRPGRAATPTRRAPSNAPARRAVPRGGS